MPRALRRTHEPSGRRQRRTGCDDDRPARARGSTAGRRTYPRVARRLPARIRFAGAPCRRLGWTHPSAGRGLTARRLALSRVHPVRAGSGGLICVQDRAERALCSRRKPVRATHTSPRTKCLPRVQVSFGMPWRGPREHHGHDGGRPRRRHPGRLRPHSRGRSCTGLGALRRRPEARWRKKPGDVPELATLQRELLTAAVKGLRPGGVLAYVTCSPHLAETRDIAEAVTDEFSEELREIDARGALESISGAPLDFGDTPGMRAQLWPHRHGTDAMSVSLWQRR